MNNLAVQNDPQARITGYDQEQITRFAAIVKTVAPWAKDLTNHEIGLGVRRALSMGLDPLNTHEVQIWKDKRGNINFQLSYTLMAEWVRHFHGGHTEPQYYRLTEDQLIEEGLKANDVAYRVKFIMKSDLPAMREMMQIGAFDTREVRAMFEVAGLGVAEAREYSGQYFAPAGRSKSWKVKKRALTDAYRRKFGTPSKSEIEAIRRDMPDVVDPEDIEYAISVAPNASLEGQRAIAEAEQARRENPLSEEDQSAGAAALFGGAEVVEAEVVEAAPEPPEEPEQAGVDGEAIQARVVLNEARETVTPKGVKLSDMDAGQLGDLIAYIDGLDSPAPTSTALALAAGVMLEFVQEGTVGGVVPAA